MNKTGEGVGALDLAVAELLGAKHVLLDLPDLAAETVVLGTRDPDRTERSYRPAGDRLPSLIDEESTLG